MPLYQQQVEKCGFHVFKSADNDVSIEGTAAYSLNLGNLLIIWLRFFILVYYIIKRLTYEHIDMGVELSLYGGVESVRCGVESVRNLVVSVLD